MLCNDKHSSSIDQSSSTCTDLEQYISNHKLAVICMMIDHDFIQGFGLEGKLTAGEGRGAVYDKRL